MANYYHELDAMEDKLESLDDALEHSIKEYKHNLKRLERVYEEHDNHKYLSEKELEEADACYLAYLRYEAM